MALHHHAIEAKQRRRRVWTQLFAKLHEASLGEQHAKLGGEAAVQGGAQFAADVARRTLGGLQCDIAGESVGDDHVDLVLKQLVALDEAAIVQIELAATQNTVSLTDLFMALHVLGADVQQADGRLGHAVGGAMEGLAEDGELDQALGVAIDIGPDVENRGDSLHTRPAYN